MFRSHGSSVVVHPTDEAQSEFNPALVNNEPISDVPSNYLKYVGLHAAHVGVKEVGHHADAVLPHLSEFIVINHLQSYVEENYKHFETQFSYSFKSTLKLIMH